MNRRSLDAFAGTARDLLRLLRDLHNGTARVDGLSRLDAIQLTCDRLADLRQRGEG